jgi:hypothetical protein
MGCVGPGEKKLQSFSQGSSQLLISKVLLYAGAEGGRYDPEVHGKRVGQMGNLDGSENLLCGAHPFQLRMLLY